ncbi:MAG: DUF3226 domain-containing protein [Chitinophagales bacterium]
MTVLVSKVLLVEGIEDEKVISKLLPRRKIQYKDFTISNQNGLQKLLQALPTFIKTGNYAVIGVIVDADNDLQKRWEEIRQILQKSGYQNIPSSPSPKGIVLEDEYEDLATIGVWLMPNNQISGALEDFIQLLIPEKDDLLPIAEETIQKLIADGKSRFSVSSDKKAPKALIHTWLAWQERPGTLLGNAITYRYLKTQAYLLDDGKASDFIEWMQKLFKDL